MYSCALLQLPTRLYIFHRLMVLPERRGRKASLVPYPFLILPSFFLSFSECGCFCLGTRRITRRRVKTTALPATASLPPRSILPYPWYPCRPEVKDNICIYIWPLVEDKKEGKRQYRRQLWCLSLPFTLPSAVMIGGRDGGRIFIWRLWASLDLTLGSPGLT